MAKKGRIIKIALTDEIKMRDSLDMKTFTVTIKKFVVHSILGWFPSLRKDLSPDGVHKTRIIDRKNDRYHEKVVDVKTGRVIHNVDEKLSDHK